MSHVFRFISSVSNSPVLPQDPGRRPKSSPPEVFQKFSSAFFSRTVSHRGHVRKARGQRSGGGTGSSCSSSEVPPSCLQPIDPQRCSTHHRGRVRVPAPLTVCRAWHPPRACCTLRCTTPPASRRPTRTGYPTHTSQSRPRLARNARAKCRGARCPRRGRRRSHCAVTLMGCAAVRCIWLYSITTTCPSTTSSATRTWT